MSTRGRRIQWKMPVQLRCPPTSFIAWRLEWLSWSRTLRRRAGGVAHAGGACRSGNDLPSTSAIRRFAVRAAPLQLLDAEPRPLIRAQLARPFDNEVRAQNLQPAHRGRRRRHVGLGALWGRYERPERSFRAKSSLGPRQQPPPPPAWTNHLPRNGWTHHVCTSFVTQHTPRFEGSQSTSASLMPLHDCAAALPRSACQRIYTILPPLDEYAARCLRARVVTLWRSRHAREGTSSAQLDVRAPRGVPRCANTCTIRAQKNRNFSLCGTGCHVPKDATCQQLKYPCAPNTRDCHDAWSPIPMECRCAIWQARRSWTYDMQPPAARSN
jgi:hypothetical protein